MVEDNPQDLVHDLAAEAVFGGAPARPARDRQRRRDLERLAAGRSLVPPAGVRRRERRARGRRATSGTTGSSSDVRRASRRPRGRRAARARKPAPRGAARRAYRFLRKEHRAVPRRASAAPGIARDDERRYAVSLLDAILGGSASSRLFQEIREKRGMAYRVYSYGSQYAETGQVGIYVGTREDNLAECLDGRRSRSSQDVAAGNLRPGELERAKENLKGRLLLSLESTSSRMTRLGKALVTGTRARLRSRRSSGGSRPSQPDEVAGPRTSSSRRTRLSAAGHRPERERVPRRRRARQPGAPREGAP